MSSNIIFITGPTCSGKTTIKKYLLENIKDSKNLLLNTTRPIRDGEIDGVDYNFDIDENLAEYIKSNRLFEYIMYETSHGNWWYYTLKNSIKDNNTYIISASIDTLFRYYKNILNLDMVVRIIPIVLETEKETIEKRYKQRQSDNQDDPEIERRINSDIEKYKKYEYLIEKIVLYDNIFLNTGEKDLNELCEHISNRVTEIIG